MEYFSASTIIKKMFQINLQWTLDNILSVEMLSRNKEWTYEKFKKLYFLDVDAYKYLVGIMRVEKSLLDIVIFGLKQSNKYAHAYRKCENFNLNM